MNFTHSQLFKMGYKVDTNGNYSRPEAKPKGVSNSKPKCNAKQTLEPLPQAKKGSKNRTHIRIARYSCRPLDCDNYAGGCKALIDELRYAGIIQDDDPETIQVEFIQFKVPHKTEERTEIEVKQL